MRQVMHALRQPMIRSAVAALTLSGLMVFGGTALARPAANPKSVQPAATTTVKVLGMKLLKQHATGAGAIGTLLSVGGVSTWAVCTDQGGSSFKVELQFKSSPSGAILEAASGAATLTGSYATVFNAFNTVGNGFAIAFDVMTTAGKYQHYQADFSIHELGSDCITRLALLSD